MLDKEPSIINIGIVGGAPFCKEIIEKSALDYRKEPVNARFIAVADPDPQSPGMVLGRELGLITVDDYHELYDPRHNIHLIIVLIPEQHILEDILKTRPLNIRVLSYHVFELFWRAISSQERKLRVRTEEMETILNAIQDFILVITPDREILEVNDAFQEKIGYSREEVVGRKCYEIFQKAEQPCDRGDVVCPLHEAIRNKRPSQQVRTWVASDGKRRYVEVTVYPIWEKDGKISKLIEISRNITDRKKQEEQITRRLEEMVEERTRQLKESNAKLIHQDKMASLGKLSASVVHEINNPIAGTLNLIMLIKRIIDEGSVHQEEIEQFSEYLNLMETENRRISRIITNLLAFSRQSRMRLKRVNLNRLIEKTLFLNSNLLKINRVKVETRLSQNLPDLVGSEDQLQQVFMNFISNAVEAMEAPGGGVLTIKTRHSAKKNNILVSFKDSGIGIPPENLSKLFEPFYTTKKKGKGVGLGLSVAYGIVEEHGGSISVDSEVGKGTTLKVMLPLKQPPDTPDPDGGPHGQH